VYTALSDVMTNKDRMAVGRFINIIKLKKEVFINDGLFLRKVFLAKDLKNVKITKKLKPGLILIDFAES